MPNSSFIGGFDREREIKLIRQEAKKINTKKKALKFLESAGICTKTGRLKKQFR